PKTVGRGCSGSVCSLPLCISSAEKEQEAKWESACVLVMGEIVVGISGASGAIYGQRLTEVLSQMGRQVRLIVTDSGRLTLKHECDNTPEALAEATGAILEDAKNVGAKSASGSAKIDAVVICPCSGTTIGKLAAGISDNLVTRSAIVAMKERRKLIIVPREAPYATVHLENMAKLSAWDTIIVPASPGFYNHPRSIDDLVDFIVARVLDLIGIENDLGRRWTGDEI
ncbi:MAG: UbiX family flavin prenyltransferase, partial [Poseidonia sp.]